MDSECFTDLLIIKYFIKGLLGTTNSASWYIQIVLVFGTNSTTTTTPTTPTTTTTTDAPHAHAPTNVMSVNTNEPIDPFLSNSNIVFEQIDLETMS